MARLRVSTSADSLASLRVSMSADSLINFGLGDRAMKNGNSIQADEFSQQKNPRLGLPKYAKLNLSVSSVFLLLLLLFLIFNQPCQGEGLCSYETGTAVRSSLPSSTLLRVSRFSLQKRTALAPGFDLPRYMRAVAAQPLHTHTHARTHTHTHSNTRAHTHARTHTPTHTHTHPHIPTHPPVRASARARVGVQCTDHL